MGKGRKKIPDQIKAIRGTLRDDRKNDIPDIPVVSKMPAPPKYFNSHSRRFWRKVGIMAIDLGILNSINIGSFEIMASEYGIYREAQETMGSLSEMIHEGKDKIGNSISHIKAMRQISQNALQNFLRISVEFGLTPGSIGKVAMTRKEKANDPMKEFL